MAKTNSGGSPRGRKPASARASAPKRTSKPGAGPAKRTSKPGGRTLSGDKPARGAAGGASKRGGFAKKSSRPFKAEGGFDKESRSERPFKKFDKKGSSDRPFKREGGFDKESRSERPFKKFDSKGSADKPFRSRGGFEGDARGERPFKKFDDKRGGARPFNKAGDERGSRDEAPFKKFDRKGGSDRPFKKAGADRETRGEAPFKKFDREGGDRPFKRGGDERPGKSFAGRRASAPDAEGREERSFERPAKRPFEKFDKSKLTRKGSALKGDTGTENLEAPAQTGKIRLNKYIANSGVCSRREADELITMGLISVNGKVITELGYKVNPGDEVRHESKVLRAEKPVYILMNKPKGFLTTTVDPQERNTVMHLIGNKVKERVYPVGRLDRNTTGLLLLTNDGDLADKLMHPSYNVRKIYKVELDRPLTKNDAQAIVDGVKLDEGKAQVDDLAIISEDKKTVGLEIHIGWNRVVRRIFESLGYEVMKLDRSVYAGLTKKDLGRGEWRFLTKEELVLLKHYK